MDVTDFILDPRESITQRNKMYDLDKEVIPDVKSFKVYKKHTRVHLNRPMSYEEVFDLVKQINDTFKANFALKI